MKRAALVALIVLGGVSVANPGDVRFRRPSTHDIPGFHEGRYASESAINVLPDVITSTVELLTPIRTVDDLVPERTVIKR